MNLHLAEIAKAVAPGAHAVLLVDQAGWHLSAGLFIPANITIIPLPPKCPELNPVENIWQYMRDNWLSNRIFKSYDDIVDHCLLRLEYARRPSLENHVHRAAPMGARVLINEMWYNACACYHYLCTRGYRAHRAPGIPCALLLERAER